MNKDVIYIEPENDITDIIDKVKTSKSKIIALVPPKKSSVLGSTVNFKLLARASKAASKNIVLVTSDASLLKLASIAEIPVAKTLQSRPEIPLIIKDGTTKKDDGTVGAEEANDLAKEAKEDAPEPPSEAEAIEIIEAEEESRSSADSPSEDADDKKSDKKSKKDKKKSPVPSMDRLRKWIILGVTGVILITGFLVWAFVFAPAVKITIAVRTTGDNFSPNISFVTDTKKEIIDEGIFALESTTLTKKSTADFTATGETNKGDKATGTISVRYVFGQYTPSAITIAANTTFTNNGLVYNATSATILTDDQDKCEPDSAAYTCAIVAKVPVTASAAGEKYNTTASTGWSSSNNTVSTMGASISGGTDKIVKIVSQEDFNRAKASLASIDESAAKEELLKKFPDSTLAIGNSLSVDAKTPTSTPKVGEEVKEDVIPQISAETVFSMYGVDLNSLSDFIELEYAPKVPKGQTIYSTGVSSDPDENKIRIENFKIDGDDITGKLHAWSIQVGPSITEEEVLEKSRGRKIGEVNSVLKSMIGGNGSVDIEKSVFWVSSIPDDPNKIEIIITIEQ